MTEETAKTKRCCAASAVSWVLGKAVNLNCIGSECMAWRARTNAQMGYDRNPDDICPTGYYCGMAGKP